MYTRALNNEFKGLNPHNTQRSIDSTVDTWLKSGNWRCMFWFALLEQHLHKQHNVGTMHMKYIYLYVGYIDLCTVTSEEFELNRNGLKQQQQQKIHPCLGMYILAHVQVLKKNYKAFIKSM